MTTLTPERDRPATSLAIWLNLLAVYIIWGSTYLAIRFAVETIPPFLMAGVRHLIVAVLLLAWSAARGHMRPTGKEWRAAGIVGVFLLVGGNGVVTWSEQRIASGLAALLLGAIPLFIVILDALRPGGQRPGKLAIVGVVLGFLGVVALIGPSRISGATEHVDLIGAIAVLFASLSWAIGTLIGRSAPHPQSPLLGTGMQSLAAGAVLIIVAAIAGNFGQFDAASVSLKSFGGFLYLIFFGSCVGFAAYGWLIRNAPTTLVSTYAYINPLVAIMLGAWLASEPLTLNILLAAGLILGSVALITTKRRPSPAQQPVATTAESV